ncbi:MAG: serine/threonine-protein kinase [Acidobacteriota bacterium]
MRFGRFEVQRVLGRGGMGTVYLAVDPLIGRTVAIKEIRVDPSDDERERRELEARFKLEFRAAGKLSHPNIVTIYDVGQGGNSYFIAMEYVAGMSLADRLRKQPEVAPEDLCRLATQIASGLDYAHQRDIVHRDIKPANVLLTQDDRPKITDFGLVKMLASELTMTGTVLGTPAFMSPEQVMGDDVDGASDQFSFAVILYLMLTGTQPFAADHPSAILYKIVNEAPTPPATVKGALPLAVDKVILRGLSKRPEDRFPTCTALAEALAAALDGDSQQTMAAQLLDASPSAGEPATDEPATDEPAIDNAPSASSELAVTAPLTPASYQLDSGPTLTSRPRRKSSPPALKALAVLALIIAMAGLGYIASTIYRPTPPAEATAPEAVPVDRQPVEQVLRVEAGPAGANISINGQPTPSTVPGDVTLSGQLGDRFLIEVIADGEITASKEVVLTSEALEAWMLEPEVAEALTLEITSVPPGARIALDGNDSGLVTPAKHAFGGDRKHSLVLTLDGYESAGWSFALADLSDEQKQSGRIHFPLSSSEPPGYLTANASFPLEIRVGSQLHGPFPSGNAIELPVPPGRHEVTLVAEDVFLSQTISVDIASRQRVPLRLPRIVQLRITANPANCQVSINGREVDVTPINNLPIAVGPHDFTFHWPNLGKTKEVRKVVTRSLRRISETPD